MELNKLGEYGLIERIRGYLRKKKHRRLKPSHSCFRAVIGPGDDCAAVSLPSGGKVLLFSTDTLAEGTHFRLGWAKTTGVKEFWKYLGCKAVAVNLGDIAAMGCAKPLFYLVNIGLPGSMNTGCIDMLYSGMEKLSDEFGIELIGGDTYRSDKITIAVTIIGEADRKLLILRSGAKPGDSVYVTGAMGGSRAGLEILNSAGEKKSLGPAEKYLVKRHLCPPVRLKEAWVIAPYASAMMDCSDGLYWSLATLAKESGAGMEIDIDRIPVSPQMKAWARSESADIKSYAVSGGEEYELVFCSGKTVPLKIGARQVGVVTRGREVEYYSCGKKIDASRFRPFLHYKK